MGKKTFGKIPPNKNGKGITIEVPDGYTVIVIKPDDTDNEVTTRSKVYKPDMTAEKHNEIIAMAESISPHSNNNSNTDTDGFIITI